VTLKMSVEAGVDLMFHTWWIADQSNLVWAYRLAAIPLFVSFILFLILHFLESKHDKAYKMKLNLST